MGFLSKIAKKLKKYTSPIIGAGMGFLTGTGSSTWKNMLGGALGQLGGSYEQEQTNKANSAQALQAQQHTTKEAALNRSFQERMSNTSHQREVSDLKAAGLNPMLSVNSGASSPGGNVAPGQQAVMKNKAESAASTAMAYAQIQNVQAQTELTKKQASAIIPISKVGTGVGDLVDNLSGHVNNSASKLQQMITQWYRDQSSITGNVRRNRGPYVPPSMKSNAVAYPTEGPGSKSTPLTPLTSKETESFHWINFDGNHYKVFTRTKNGVKQSRMKNTPWITAEQASKHKFKYRKYQNATIN